MFIDERELFRLQQSHLYRDYPLAYIFYREFVRKGIFKKPLERHLFENYYTKYFPYGSETMFQDGSFLILNFRETKAYVIHSSSCLFKALDFSQHC